MVFEYPDLRILENYMVSVSPSVSTASCAVAADDNTMPGQQGRLVSHALTLQRIAMARSPPEARPVPRTTRYELEQRLAGQECRPGRHGLNCQRMV